jgi:hypothetical protein
MKTSRLARLSALTQGAALLGSLGTFAACDKTVSSEPPQPPTVNATATPPATASVPVAPADGDAGARRRFPILNAPPGRMLPADDADTGNAK